MNLSLLTFQGKILIDINTNNHTDILHVNPKVYLLLIIQNESIEEKKIVLYTINTLYGYIHIKNICTQIQKILIYVHHQICIYKKRTQ
jgi:hypothetical protein